MEELDRNHPEENLKKKNETLTISIKPLESYLRLCPGEKETHYANSRQERIFSKCVCMRGTLITLAVSRTNETFCALSCLTAEWS